MKYSIILLLVAFTSSSILSKIDSIFKHHMCDNKGKDISPNIFELIRAGAITFNSIKNIKVPVEISMEDKIYLKNIIDSVKKLNEHIDSESLKILEIKVKNNYKQILDMKKFYQFDINVDLEERKNAISNFWTGKTTDYDVTAVNDKLIKIMGDEFYGFIGELYRTFSIKSNINVLELAAGNGRKTKIFNDYLKNNNLTAKIDVLEPSASLLGALIERKLEFLNETYNIVGEDLVCKKKYDLVFFSWYLENLLDKDLLPTLIKLKNCMNKNGVLFAIENHNASGLAIRTFRGQRLRPFEVYKLLYNLANIPIDNVVQYEFTKGTTLMTIFGIVSHFTS